MVLNLTEPADLNENKKSFSSQSLMPFLPLQEHTHSNILKETVGQNVEAKYNKCCSERKTKKLPGKQQGGNFPGKRNPLKVKIFIFFLEQLQNCFRFLF